MKKIEEAAREFYDDNYNPKYSTIDPFIAGARYVLDQLTTALAVRAWSAAETAATPERKELYLSEFLAAIRKEIEGE